MSGDLVQLPVEFSPGAAVWIRPRAVQLITCRDTADGHGQPVVEVYLPGVIFSATCADRDVAARLVQSLLTIARGAA